MSAHVDNARVRARDRDTVTAHHSQERQATRPDADLRTRTSTADDRAWDAFLGGLDGGHHTQTSMWAQVKAALGWQAVRVVAEQHGGIVGGVQLLYRPVRAVGAVGFVSRGPVLARPDDVVGARLLDEMEQITRELNIRHLTLQPPGRVDEVPPFVVGRPYLPSDTQVAPRATVLVDVTPEPDDILAAMSSKTRYNVRLSGRRPVTVRDGDATDLPTYHRILVATGARQGFTPLPRRYFEHMWDVLAPRGMLRLCVADVEGTPVAAQIAVAFGDTVVNKLSVWSGEAGTHRPNEAVQWATIQWAHAHGFRWYDLEGLRLEAAHAVVRGEPIPEAVRQSVASYKLGFGGQVVVMPRAHVWVPNPAARWAFDKAYPKIAEQRWFRTMVKRMRTATRGDQ